MLRTNKTGKKFTIARPVKPSASANVPAPTPLSSGVTTSALTSQSAAPVPCTPSENDRPIQEAIATQPAPVALPPTPDATQDRSARSPLDGASPIQHAAIPSSPPLAQRPLFFPEPTPPPTQPVNVSTADAFRSSFALPQTSAPMGLHAPANAPALPLAPQMPNPFLHPQIPAPIASSSTATFGLAPPSSSTLPTSSTRTARASTSQPGTDATSTSDAASKAAEREKRRLSRRKKLGLEGPGRRYRTTEEIAEAEAEGEAGVSSSGAEKRKRGRPTKSGEGAAKKKRAKGKGKETDAAAGAPVDGPGEDLDGEEDPEAQIMREEAEKRAGSSTSQSSIAEPLGAAAKRSTSNVADQGEDEDDEDEDDTTESGRRQRGRRRKIVNDDIDLESAVAGQSVGPAIDPRSMTMAEIAAHPGYGRVSARGLELQARRIELAKEKREKLSRRKGRNGTADGDNQSQESSEDEEADGPQTTESAYNQLMRRQAQAEKDAKAAARARRANNGGHESDPGNNGKDVDPDDEEDGDINETDLFRERNAAAQIRIENGNIIIDESSLQIESGQALNDFDMGTMEIVEEHDKDRFINAYSYQRKPRGTRWTREETDLLFEKTREFGTSFDIIMHFFPGKTRKHIINQWNRMCKNNDPRADWAYDVAHRKTIDFSGLEKASNMTFSTQSIDQILQQQEEEMQSEVQALLGLVAQPEGGGDVRQGSPSSSRGGGNATDGESSRPLTAAEMARKKAKDKRAAKKAWKDQFGGGAEEVVGTIDD